MFEKERDRNLPDTIIFNVEEVATMLEDQLGDFLKEAPKGLYTKTSLEPLVHFGGKTYKILNTRGRKMHIKLTPENTQVVDGVVMDRLGNFVDLLDGPGAKLYMGPQMPVMGLQIVKDCIDSIISQGLKWVPAKASFPTLLERHIKDEFLVPVQQIEQSVENHVPILDMIRTPNPQLIAIEEHVNVIMSDIRAMVGVFVHNDPWGMYNCTFKRLDVTITRVGDFRVNDWMERFGKHYK